MSWKSLEITVPDVGLGSLVDIINSIKNVIETLSNILETILSFYEVRTDPLVALIESIVEKLRAIVESFLEDLGGYVLYVPIRKRLKTDFLGLGDITPSWAGNLGIFGSPNSPVDWNSPELGEFIDKTNRYNGGNAGFFKTVIDSLYDDGDGNKPMFLSEEDYIGGTVLVMGTDFDPLGFLDDIWRFSGIFDSPDLVTKVPRPQNLKVRVIEGINNTGFSSLLTWDAPDVPVHSLPDLGNVILHPTRYAIIRGKNTIGALSANNVIDLMGKRELSQGDTFSNGDMVVVFEDEYDLSKMSYIDENIATTPDDSFYYAVAWKLNAYNANETDIVNNSSVLEYWHISNVVRVTPYQTKPASTPPDWIRTPTVSSLFPQFAELLRLMLAQIESFSSRLLGGDDLIRNYINFLRSEVDRYTKIVSDITDSITRLSFKFTMPTAGIYARTFKGVGGNDFFISDLANSLLPSFEGSPPFHRGDEYVTGAVILAGGTETIVDGLITSLSWVFGTPSDDGMDEMLTELGVAINDMEEKEFGTDLTQIENTTESTNSIDSNDPLLKPRNSTTISKTLGPNLEVTD